MLAAIALVIAASVSTSAQTSISFSPLLTQLAVAPGSSGQFVVVLRNDSPTDTVECSIYAADIAQRTNGRYSALPAGSSAHSAARMMELSADRAIVEPGGSFAVTATVAVPWGESGGRYGAIVFEVDPDPKNPGAAASTAVVQRFMSAVEISIAGRAVERRLDIVGFSVTTSEDEPAYAVQYGNDVVVLSADVRNSGAVHVFAVGNMVLRTAEGRRLFETPIGGGRGIVLPGATVALATVMPDGLAPGNYIADLSVGFDGSRPVSARVPFTVGGGGGAAAVDAGRRQSLTAIAPFSVLPAELELNYAAGATVTRAVTVENRSGQRIQVTCAPEAILLAEGTVAPSCQRWIKLWPDTFALQPGARQTVQMLLTIPEAEWGGRYADLVFAARPATPDDGAWSARSGTRVHLTVGKDQVVEGTLSPVFIEDAGATLGKLTGTVFTNTGSVHVTPRTGVQLKTSGGSGAWTLLHSVDLGRESVAVLPGEEREIVVSLPASMGPGRYMVEFSVDLGVGEAIEAQREFVIEAPKVPQLTEERGDIID